MLFYFPYPSLFFLFALEFTMILRHGLRSWRHSENDISAGPPKSENKGSTSQKPLTQNLPPRPGPSKPNSFCLQKWIWCAAKHLPMRWTGLSGRSRKAARANAGSGSASINTAGMRSRTDCWKTSPWRISIAGLPNRSRPPVPLTGI